MLDVILVGIVMWVVIPIVFGICAVHIVLRELDAEEHRKAHRENLLEAITTSNLDKENKAEIICKFSNCRRE